MTDEATIRRVLELAGTWAVVGWSPRADRPSHEVAAYLEQVGYPVVRVNPNVDPSRTSGLQVVPTQLGDEAGIIGAAVMVLETILAPAAVDAALVGAGRQG